MIQLQVGPEKSFRLHYIAPTRDLRSTTWSGTYHVVAAKDTVHLNWRITDEETRGRAGYRELGVILAKGQTVPAMLEYLADGKVALTFLDDKGHPLGRFTLEPQQ